MSDISGSIDRLIVELEELRKMSRRLERVEFERDRLQHALSLLTSYVQQATEGMALFDLGGTVLLANKSYASAHGFAPSDLIGKHQSIFFTPEQADTLDGITHHVSEEGEFEGEIWHGRKDGSVFPAFVHIRTVTDEHGGPIGFIEAMRDVSELKKAEVAVRESEERFKAQYRGLPIPVYTWQKTDDDFALVDFNRAAEVITNGKIKGLRGARIGDLYHDAPDIHEQIWKCFNEKTSFTREIPYALRSAGEANYLIISYGYVPPDIVLVHTQDVTERVKAEQALKASEEKYRDLVENINDVICTFDTEGIITYVSPAVESLLGFKPIELLGRSFVEFVSAEAAAQITENFRQALNGEPGAGEYRLTSKWGEDRWIRSSSHPILEDGRIVGLHSVLGDITESKLAETAIRESEEKFRMLAERSPNMIFINKMGRIVYVNRRSEEIMGYSKEEFYREGFDFQTLVAPDFLELTRRSFERHRTGEDVEPYEYALITKAGERLDAIIATKLIEYEGDRAILGIVTDITDRKETERALLESESRYRAIARLCSDSTYEVRVDAEGGFVLEWASKEEDRISSFPVDRAITVAHWTEAIHPEEQSAVMTHLQTLLKGHSDTAEFRVRAKTGEWRWVRNRAQPVWDEEAGRFSRIHGIVQDISAEGDTIALLREREQLYRALIDGSKEAMLTHQDGRIVFANAASAALLGSESPEELLRRPISEFVPADTLASVEHHLNARDPGDTSPRISPGRCVRIDGSTISVELTALRISFHKRNADQLYIRHAAVPGEKHR